MVKTISRHQELQDLLTGVKPWRNPVYDSKPKVDFKEFHEFLNKKLVPGPEVFRKIELIYQRQKVKRGKSEITEYVKETVIYYYEHPKSKFILEINCKVNPVFFYIVVEKPPPSDFYYTDWIELDNYLQFKTKTSLYDNIDKEVKEDPYKYFEYCMKVLEDAILNKGLGKIIKGKWENIPDPIKDLFD